jgi:putative ABC transport system substrate-binding protein
MQALTVIGRLSRRCFMGGLAGLGVSAAGSAVLSSACGMISPPATARVSRIGYLSPGPREAMTSWIDPFLDGLRELGYVDGQTIDIVWRFMPGGSDAQFAELAADLVRLPVDLIAARTSSAVLGAKQTTSTIPIVSLGATNLRGIGLVASLARPAAT